MIAEAGDWMTCWTMGLNQSTHGTWNTNAICNLHLATGAICRPGSGPISLTGQPNAMGGREMGYMGPGLPGQRSVLSRRRPGLRRGAVGPGARAPSAATSGPARSRCSEQMAAGEIKACWIICTNPVASVANGKTVIAGLEAAELVITQDAYADTATNRYADIVLPAALWAEADGVMVNSERNLTLLQQSIPPAGDARPGLGIDLPASPQTWGSATHFDYKSSERDLRRDPPVPQPADRIRPARRQLRAAARKPRCSGPCPPEDDRRHDRNPIRYLNDGVSPGRCTSTSRRTAARGWRSPRRRGGRCSTPARTWTPPSCPTTTTRWSSTPAGCSTSGTP